MHIKVMFAPFLIIGSAVLTLSVVILAVAAEENCTCGYYEGTMVGPYCSTWTEGDPPYCFLSNRASAKDCPGAVQNGDDDIYWTEDDNICKKSSNYSLQHCKCAYHEQYPRVMPFCGKWVDNYPPFCLLAEYPKGLFCPGALKESNNIYSTKDEAICNKSTPQVLNLSMRRPYTVTETVQLCIFSLTVLIGTIGNGLVVKYFASENVQSRPGSRFVIVLGFLDCISSIWIPGSAITNMIYNGIATQYWPFGEVTCRIVLFYPLLLYATPWLLVAISIERARAIYRPFADRLHTKFVILISFVILAISIGLTLKIGLSTVYFRNLFIRIGDKGYEYPICYYHMNAKEALDNYLLSNSLGIWFPMLLIVIVYAMMYVRLKHQAEIRQQASSHDSRSQLTRISRSFTTVLVTFYVCYLPATIQHIMYFHYRYYKKEISPYVYNDILTITNLLLFSNSCMNPIIYSKIHLKIYRSIRKFIASCKQKWSCGATLHNTITCACCHKPFQKETLDSSAQPLTKTTNLMSDQRPYGHKDVHCAPEREELQANETSF